MFLLTIPPIINNSGKAIGYKTFGLHLFVHKYNENSNIVKYKCNLNNCVILNCILLWWW